MMLVHFNARIALSLATKFHSKTSRKVTNLCLKPILGDGMSMLEVE
jgi:hypothetical protein